MLSRLRKHHLWSTSDSDDDTRRRPSAVPRSHALLRLQTPSALPFATFSENLFLVRSKRDVLWGYFPKENDTTVERGYILIPRTKLPNLIRALLLSHCVSNSRSTSSSSSSSSSKLLCFRTLFTILSRPSSVGTNYLKSR